MKSSCAPPKTDTGGPGRAGPRLACVLILTACLLGSGGVPRGEATAQNPAGGAAAEPAPKPAPPPVPAPPGAASKPAKAPPAAKPAAPAARSAERIIAAVQARYERVRDLRGSFVQESNVASLGRKDTSSGTVIVKRPGRMRWEYRKPEERVLTLDGQTVQMYTPSERQLQVAPLSPESFSPTALSFLLGDGDLRESFTAELLKEEGRDEIGLRLNPRSDASFEHLELWLDPKDLELRESVVVDLFGNRTSVRFSDVVENTNVPESVFKVDVPPETEVIDLR